MPPPPPCPTTFETWAKPEMCFLFYICRLKAEKALWFAETYGLSPKTLTMADSTGTEINVPIGRDQHPGYNTNGHKLEGCVWWGGGVGCYVSEYNRE